IVFFGQKPYEEWLSESRVRENLKHGLMRGWWKHSALQAAGAPLFYSTKMAKFYSFIVGKMRCNNIKCEMFFSVILSEAKDLISVEILRPSASE
ncbi:MAG: hypothetical protein KJ931_05050, partial [Candidatus Omnitrophica bacterium]|nr:hypothetical protein [Candidatus Omnitrophota bacterium]